MSQIGTYTVDTQVGKRHVIQESCKGLYLRHTFNASNILAGELDLETPTTILSNFITGVGAGKVSITYTPSAGKPVPIATSIEYVAFLEFCAQITGKKIRLEWVGMGADNHTYALTAYVPFSLQGCIPLSDNDHIIVEFDAFANIATGNTQAEDYDMVIDIDTDISPYDSNSILRIDTKSTIAANLPLEVACTNYASLFCPGNVSKLKLDSMVNGRQFEIAAATKDRFVFMNTTPTFNSLGHDIYHARGFMVNVLPFSKLSLTLTESRPFYLVTAQTI